MGTLAPIALCAFLAGCAASAPQDHASLRAYAANLKQGVGSARYALAQPLSVHQAIAHAVLSNADLKVRALEAMLARADTRVASAEQLPQFIATAGSGWRDRHAASSSAPVSDPRNRGRYGVSSQRVSKTADLGVSWNILDLGIAHFRARQKAQQATIAAERYRRAIQVLAEETRVVFWRAVALEKLDAGLAALNGDMDLAMARARELTQSGLISPTQALAGERDLMEVRRQLDEHRRQLLGSREQLNALLNIAPHTQLKLDLSQPADMPLPRSMAFDDLATIALSNRPEIAQVMATEKISAEEARIALLELFPGLSLSASGSLDANPFLMSQGWVSAAAAASWHLIKLVKYPARSRSIKTQRAIDRQKARAVAIGVVLQAQLSLSRLDQGKRELQTLDNLAALQRRLLDQMENLHEVGRAGDAALTLERMKTLLAKSRRDAAIGEVQSGYANVYSSFGFDTYGQGYRPSMTPEQLAALILQNEKAMRQRLRQLARRKAAVLGVRPAEPMGAHIAAGRARHA